MIGRAPPLVAPHAGGGVSGARRGGPGPRAGSLRARRMGRCRSAEPAQADGAVAQLITEEDMLNYFKSGEKPHSKWRIGTEHEKLGFNLGTHERLTYEQIRTILNKLHDRFGWTPVMDNGNIIGLQMDGQSVSLEPGGQFELSGAPLRNLHMTCGELHNHLYQVKAIAEEMGVGFLGIGFDPKWDIPDVPIMPKGRYNIMMNYMPKVGSLGLDMMFRSCTVQTNLDFDCERDMVEKMRLGVALQPLATAMFANSPFRDGKPSGYLSWRMQVWQDTDDDRCGNLPFVFDPDFGYKKYLDYCIDVPMYFVNRDRKYIDLTGHRQTFRDFLEGKLIDLPGERPSMADFELHLTTIFPEVRLKKYIEMRGADGGPWKMICALPAFWVGLLYDSDAKREAVALIESWTQEDRDYLFRQVPKTALATPFKGRQVRDWCLEFLEIAKGGLERRAQGEETFLRGVFEIVEKGETPAEALLRKYENEWGGNLDRIYDELEY
ncbi:unnamed protein product [Pedinophyceae sp. YPF-701]|nr:unnamed protein product [Pedinophyceae sp. YPF-701]